MFIVITVVLVLLLLSVSIPTHTHTHQTRRKNMCYDFKLNFFFYQIFNFLQALTKQFVTLFDKRKKSQLHFSMSKRAHEHFACVDVRCATMKIKIIISLILCFHAHTHTNDMDGECEKWNLSRKNNLALSVICFRFLLIQSPNCHVY